MLVYYIFYLIFFSVRTHYKTHTHSRAVNDEKCAKEKIYALQLWPSEEKEKGAGPAVPVTGPAVYIAWSTCINNGNILNQSSDCRKAPKRKAQTGASI